MRNRENQMKLLGVCLLLFLAIVACNILPSFKRVATAYHTIAVLEAEDPQDATSGPEQPVNINQADQAALEQISGIGPVLAERILAYRQEHGPFTTTEEIQQVKGIGAKTYQTIQEFICVE